MDIKSLKLQIHSSVIGVKLLRIHWHNSTQQALQLLCMVREQRFDHWMEIIPAAQLLYLNMLMHDTIKS